MSLPFCGFCRLFNAPKSCWLPSWHLPHGIGITCLGIFLSPWTEIRASGSSVLFSCQVMLNSVTLWTAAHQAPLSFTISLSLFKLMFIEPVMLSNHLIFCLPFSSCPQSFPASGSFPMTQLFVSCDQSTGALALAPVLPMNIQGWYSLGLTGLISLMSKGLPRVFSSTTIWKHQFFGAQSSLWSNCHIHTWLLEKP